MRRMYAIKNRAGYFLTVPKTDQGVATSSWSRELRRARLYNDTSRATLSVIRVREVFNDNSCHVVGLSLYED